MKKTIFKIMGIMLVVALTATIAACSTTLPDISDEALRLSQEIVAETDNFLDETHSAEVSRAIVDGFIAEFEYEFDPDDESIVFIDNAITSIEFHLWEAERGDDSDEVRADILEHRNALAEYVGIRRRR